MAVENSFNVNLFNNIEFIGFNKQTCNNDYQLWFESNNYIENGFEITCTPVKMFVEYQNDGETEWIDSYECPSFNTDNHEFFNKEFKKIIEDIMNKSLKIFNKY